MKKLLLSCAILCSCSDDTAQGWRLDEPRYAVEADAAADLSPDLSLDELNAPFVGIWRVDQPAHAGYEVTFYRFSEDGSLFEIESIGTGSGQVPTGRVARCDEFHADSSSCLTWGPECLFSNEWRATDPQTLLITSTCSDGERRKVSIHFEGVLPPEVSVRGDFTWLHNDFEWAWTRCDAIEECRI